MISFSVVTENTPTRMRTTNQPRRMGQKLAKREDNHCGLVGNQRAMAGKATPFSMIVLFFNRS